MTIKKEERKNNNKKQKYYMLTSILKRFTHPQISTSTINAYISFNMTIRKTQVLS